MWCGVVSVSLSALQINQMIRLPARRPMMVRAVPPTYVDE